MALFNREKPYDAEFVLQVINFFGLGGVDKTYLRQIEAFFKHHNSDRIETLAAAAGLVQEPESPKELYAVSRAYIWAGAKYRKEAIRLLQKFILLDKSSTETPQTDMQRSFVFTDLGDLLSGEHRFAEAVEAFQKGIDLAPSFMHNYIKQGEAYVKQGEFTKAIDALQTGRKLVPKDDRENIDRWIKDFESKRDRGYVFRARNKESLNSKE